MAGGYSTLLIYSSISFNFTSLFRPGKKYITVLLDSYYSVIVYYSRSSDEAYETYWRMVFLSIIEHVSDSNLPIPIFDETSKLWVTTLSS